MSSLKFYSDFTTCLPMELQLTVLSYSLRAMDFNMVSWLSFLDIIEFISPHPEVEITLDMTIVLEIHLANNIMLKVELPGASSLVEDEILTVLTGRLKLTHVKLIKMGVPIVNESSSLNTLVSKCKNTIQKFSSVGYLFCHVVWDWANEVTDIKLTDDEPLDKFLADFPNFSKLESVTVRYPSDQTNHHRYMMSMQYLMNLVPRVVIELNASYISEELITLLHSKISTTVLLRVKATSYPLDNSFYELIKEGLVDYRSTPNCNPQEMSMLVSTTPEGHDLTVSTPLLELYMFPVSKIAFLNLTVTTMIHNCDFSRW
ncbi:unnamed protein product [Ambrosiozyma monospora]|uniref:Unnamed protein product n=1 Tax=Ambrosiozyma monospora TaxID=43982 RepID=A0A9W6SX01_AMBMO|nr:unnamed protein product [Ambrosiozyma monospora]